MCSSGAARCTLAQAIARTRHWGTRELAVHFPGKLQQTLGHSVVVDVEGLRELRPKAVRLGLLGFSVLSALFESEWRGRRFPSSKVA